MHNGASMSNTSLLFSLVLVLIALTINYKESLGLGKDMIIGVSRMAIQLLIVSFVLKYIFKADNKVITAFIIIFMSVNAAYNASLRGKQIDGSFKISLIAIFGGVLSSLIILVATGALDFTAQQLIPITGMLAGNGMNIIGLSYRNLNTSFKDNRQKVEEKLALGATTKDASKEIMREAIKGATQPTVDTTKTVGLVALPGMMSGMMISGTDPMMAIKYQIMVYFMLLSTAMIVSVIAVYLAAPKFYNNGRIKSQEEMINKEKTTMSK